MEEEKSLFLELYITITITEDFEYKNPNFEV